VISNSDVERFSPVLLARIAGVLALIGIVTGAFDIGYVRSTLFVAGDASATYHNVLAHEALFRAGFGAHLLLLLCNIPGEIIFFLLIRRVNGVVAAVAMCCGLVGTAIEALDMVNAYVPLKLAAESGTLGAFTNDQLQGWSYVSLQIQDAGLLISFLFYGLDEMLSGFLIARSKFLPRVIGILLSISGLCYFTHGFLTFLAPALDARLYPYIIYPCLPGEGSIALWLAIVGLNADKWRAWRDEPGSKPALA
jgi:hypothetical protein